VQILDLLQDLNDETISQQAKLKRWTCHRQLTV